MTRTASTAESLFSHFIKISDMIRLIIAITCLQLHLIDAHLVVTSPARLHVRPTAYPGIAVGEDELFGRLPGHQLFKRNDDSCDGTSFFCPTGTCYTDSNTGLIGCCDVASCAPRTTCVPYTSGITSACDINTGGCLYCSDSALPSCMTITNVVASQWIHYCDVRASTETVSYTNTITANSQANTQASSSPQPSVAIGSSDAATSTSTGTTQTSSSASATSAQDSSTVPSTPSSAASSSLSNTTTGGSTISSSPSTSSSAGAAAASSSAGNALSSGDIAGIACGGAAAGALLFAAAWYIRRCWLRRADRSRNGSDSQALNGKESSESGSSPGDGKDVLLAEAEGSSPRTPVPPFSPAHVARPFELEQPHGVTNNVGLGIVGQKRYQPTNPDPVMDDGNPTIRAVPPGVSEAPGDRPLPASPGVSSLAPPDTPHSANTSTSPVSPMTPAFKYTAYTPSAYSGNEPPSSLPRTVAAGPPSLPQNYSTVSLGSTANIYRGLSRAGTAPWAYLSPEEAVKGGWRNGESSE